MVDAKDVLEADLEHIRRLLIANEEGGEKRIGFLLTLGTAIGGGLIALATAEHPKLSAQFIDRIVIATLVVFLLVCVLVYLRILRRNRQTDHFATMADTVHRQAVTSCPELAKRGYGLDWSPFETTLQKWLRAGYAEMVCLMIGVIVFSILTVLFEASNVPDQIVYGVAMAVGLLVFVSLVVVSKRRLFGKGRAAEYFRAGVGAVILNNDGKVLALERKKNVNAWQLPQGGIELWEYPEEAVLREIAEETGISAKNLAQIERYPGMLVYELPPEMRGPKTGRGQVQYWFIFKIKAPALKELHTGFEARNVRWMPFDELTAIVADFRRPVYTQLNAFLNRSRQEV